MRTSTSRRSTHLRHVTSLLYIGIAFTACAASEDSSLAHIERIEVTTHKRLLDINTINASVSALTETEIQALGIDNLQSAVRQLPGVTLTQPLKNRATINIRGINTDIGETQLTQDPVGLYVDDMPVTGTYAEVIQPDISLFDVQRIEVARGPQGTLFGSGNIGGAVRIVTNSPDATMFDAAAQLDVGHTQHGGMRRRYDAMLNIPFVSDKLALRIVASTRNEDGWIENVRLGGHNDYEEDQFRAALAWTPTSSLSVSFSALDIDSDPHDGDSYNPSLGQFLRSTAIRDPRAYDMQLYHLRVAYQIPDFAELISSTNKKRSGANWYGDLGPFDGIGDFVNQSRVYTDALSQEFRLESALDSPLTWIAGVYLFNNDITGPFILQVLGLQAFVSQISETPLASDLFFEGTIDYAMRERAAFADVTFSRSKHWEASVGARYFTTESTYSQFEQQNFIFDTLQLQPVPDYTNEVSASGLMWRTTLAYTPTQDERYYIGVSKGMRAGQTNPNIGPSFVDPTDVVIPEGYQSDALYMSEMGVKLAFSDNRIQTNIALFYGRWQDVQIDALRLSDNLNYIANAGDAETKGLEAQLLALFGQHTEGYLSFTVQNATIKSVSKADSLLSGAVTGDRLPGTPKVIANAGLSTQWTLLDNYPLTARLDVSHVGESTNRFTHLSGRAQPNPDFAYNEAYTFVQTSLTLEMQALSLTAYIENLLNNDAVILNVGATQPNPAISLRPRTVGVRMRYQL